MTPSITRKTKDKIMKFKTLMLEGWSVGKCRHITRLNTDEYHEARKDPEILCLIQASIKQYRDRQRNGQFGTYLSDERLKELGIKK